LRKNEKNPIGKVVKNSQDKSKIKKVNKKVNPGIKIGHGMRK